MVEPTPGVGVWGTTAGEVRAWPECHHTRNTMKREKIRAAAGKPWCSEANFTNLLFHVGQGCLLTLYHESLTLEEFL